MKLPTIDCICVVCKRAFKGYHKNQKYCSLDCKKAIYTKSRPANCLQCGSPIEQPIRGGRRDYCSSCAKRRFEAQRKKHDAKRRQPKCHKCGVPVPKYC